MHGQLQGGRQEVLKGALQEALSLKRRVPVFQIAKEIKKGITTKYHYDPHLPVPPSFGHPSPSYSHPHRMHY